ncbi:MAG: hypothetical protein HHAS10_00550 [Candidatus Altimarinota bacterium]
MNSLTQEDIKISPQLVKVETLKKLRDIIPFLSGKLSIEKVAGIALAVDAILYLQGYTPLANMLGITGVITIGEIYLVKIAAGK